MTDVEKSEIPHIWHVCDVENVAIYAKFTCFHVEKNWAQKYICGEKMTNMRSGSMIVENTDLTYFWPLVSPQADVQLVDREQAEHVDAALETMKQSLQVLREPSQVGLYSSWNNYVVLLLSDDFVCLFVQVQV